MFVYFITVHKYVCELIFIDCVKSAGLDASHSKQTQLMTGMMDIKLLSCCSQDVFAFILT